MAAKDWTDHLRNVHTWFRLLYIVIFVVIFWLVGHVLAILLILQFGFALFTGKGNERLSRFGGQLARYVYGIVTYLSFRSDERPFPFSDWPEDKAPASGGGKATGAARTAKKPQSKA